MKKYWWVWVIILPTILVGSYLAFILWRTWPIEEYSIAKAGTLGDSFGILTAWFSGMAFCAAVYLLHRQKVEFDRLVEHSVKIANIERVSFQPNLEFVESYAYVPSYSTGAGALQILNNNQRLMSLISARIIDLSAASPDGIEYQKSYHVNEILINLKEPITIETFDLKLDYLDMSGAHVTVTFRVETKKEYERGDDYIPTEKGGLQTTRKRDRDCYLYKGQFHKIEFPENTPD